MRGILINPRDRTVHTIDTDGSFDEMKKIIHCDGAHSIKLTADADLWIDAHGHKDVGKCIFLLSPDPTRFAGNGLILGRTLTNEACDLVLGLDKILTIVRWTELASSGRISEDGITPISSLRPADAYLIWSNEHRAWWAPGSDGYVQSIKEAGRYARQHALQICRDARGGWDGIKPPPEVPVRALDAIAAGLEGKFH